MLRREGVSPGRSCQLPGCNAWADDLKDLFEDGASSACLSDGLFAEHSGLVWAAVAMFIQRWFGLVCRQEALIISRAPTALKDWGGAGAGHWAPDSAPEKALGFACVPWVLYTDFRPGCL